MEVFSQNKMLESCLQAGGGPHRPFNEAFHREGVVGGSVKIIHVDGGAITKRESGSCELETLAAGDLIGSQYLLVQPLVVETLHSSAAQHHTQRVVLHGVA